MRTRELPIARTARLSCLFAAVVGVVAVGCSEDEITNLDASVAADTGVVRDGGTTRPDSGVVADTGVTPDSGAEDTGPRPDAGPATLTAIALRASVSTLLVGRTVQLEVEGTYSDARVELISSGITWSTSADAVATVSASGLVTAAGAGQATITAAVGNLMATRAFTITAEAPTTVVVFGDDYGADLVFAPFGGSTNALTIDTTNPHGGTASLRVEVPAGGYTGGAIAGPALDLSRFNAVSFWARASVANTLNVTGVGNDAASSTLQAELAGVALTTTWQRFVIPLPDPARFAANTGRFHFAEGDATPYTIWIDDIVYETIPAMTLGMPAPAIATETITREVGATFPVNGSSVTWMLGGSPVTLGVSRGFFSWLSSATAVATVDAGGTVTAVGAGTAEIRARLGAVDAIGVTTVNITAAQTPAAAAPTPTAAAGDVIALYSDAYPNVTVDTWSAVWDQADVADVSVAGNATKQYTNLVFAGIEFTSAVIDASQMTHFHMDVWVPTATRFTVKLVDFGAGGAFGGGDDLEFELAFEPNTTPALVTGQWVALDLPLSSFGPLADAANRAHVAQIVLAGAPGTVFVDNVYFRR
jgi:hypothetical protein